MSKGFFFFCAWTALGWILPSFPSGVDALSSTSATLSSLPSSSLLHGPQQRKLFPGLDASRFRHPLDRDLTEMLQQVPGVGTWVPQGLRQALSLVEEAVRLDLLSTAVKVSPQQLPALHELMVEACDILDITNHDDSNNAIPELYVQSNPQANAYTLGWRGGSSKDSSSRRRRTVVVVTSALLAQCNDAEIQAVLGHELGHCKCEHSVYLTTGGILATPLRNLPFIGSTVVDSTLQQWRLAAEYSCDRAALLVAQDPKVVASALLKLFAGTGSGTNNNTNKYSDDLNVDAFVQQCREYDELLKSANPLVRMAVQRQLQQRTHPLPVRRVVELEAWAASDDYARILHKGKEMTVDGTKTQ